MTDNPAPLAVEAKKSKGLWRRALLLVITVGLIVVIFASVIPQFVSFADAWTAVQSMSTAWLVALIVAAAVNQISYVWPHQAVLVHLRYRHRFFETQTRSVISKTVPAGGAVTVGMTFRMFGSFGFSKCRRLYRRGDDGRLDLGVQARVAADMMWRATTYFLPIFVGLLTYGIWKRGMSKGRYATSPDAKPSPVLAR